MSDITVSPLYDAYSGTTGKDGSATIKYRVLGTDSLIAAKAAFLATIPKTHDGHPLKDYSYDEQGFGTWIFTANYKVESEGDSSNLTRPDDFVVNFDTTGGKAKVVYSRKTTAVATPPGEKAPQFNNGIGWNGEKFEGTDIVVPSFKWTETHIHPIDFVDRSYRRLLRMMTGTVNTQPFRDMDPGEVLFLGVRGQTKKGTNDKKTWELQYSFEASPNLSRLIYGECQPVDKSGYDYLWIYTELTDDTESKKVVGRPAAVFVEQVYRWTNFANLMIGIH